MDRMEQFRRSFREKLVECVYAEGLKDTDHGKFKGFTINKQDRSVTLSYEQKEKVCSYLDLERQIPAIGSFFESAFEPQGEDKRMVTYDYTA
jgi:hypothetical protein